MSSPAQLEPCALCGERGRAKRPSAVAGGMICNACYRRELQPRWPCRRCGRIDVSIVRVSADKGICPRCYQLAHRKYCRLCGKLGRPAARTKDGGPICGPCYYNKIHLQPCGRCGRVRPVMKRLASGSAICPSCYRDAYGPKHRCDVCRKRKVLVYRNPRTGGGLCGYCYARTRHRAPCSLCGRNRAVNSRTKRGEPVCHPCWYRYFDPEVCALCGTRPKYNRRRTEEGELGRRSRTHHRASRLEACCEACHLRRFAERRACARCRRKRPVRRWRQADGQPLCARCSRAERRRRRIPQRTTVAAWGRGRTIPHLTV